MFQVDPTSAINTIESTEGNITQVFVQRMIGVNKTTSVSVHLEQIPSNFFSSLISSTNSLWVCIFLLDLKRFCHYSAYDFRHQLTILPFSCGLTIFKPTFLAGEVLRKCSIWLSFIPRWYHEAALESFTVMFTSHSATEGSEQTYVTLWKCRKVV